MVIEIFCSKMHLITGLVALVKKQWSDRKVTREHSGHSGHGNSQNSGHSKRYNALLYNVIQANEWRRFERDFSMI